MRTLFLAGIIPLVLCGAQPVPDRCAAPAGAPAAAHLRSGACYAAREQWKQAEEQFAICRRTKPTPEAATVGHANALIHLNRPFDAAFELSEMLEASPHSVPGLKLYAGLLASALENESRAALVLERCVKLAPSDPEVWRLRGGLAFSQRRMPDAIRDLETAVRLAPRDPLAVGDLAHCYAQADNAAKAAALFERALQLNRQAARPDARVDLLYADYLLQNDRASESIPFYTRSLTLNARSSEARFGRARAHEQLSEWRLAEADALGAIRQSPTRLDAHLLLARVYRSTGERQKADEFATRIKQLNGEHQALETERRRSREALRLYFEVVQPLLGEGKYAEAVKPSLEIVELWPSFASPLFVLGVCYSQTGRGDEALTYFHRYLAVRPNDPEGHAALGVLLLARARNREALPELERALALDPGMLEARKAAASIQLTAGDARQAAATLQAATNLDSEARRMLAEALLASSDRAGALREVEAVLRSDPGDRAAADLKARALGKANGR
jgi:tetratricopeptide (TPR) repeat protein